MLCTIIPQVGDEIKTYFIATGTAALLEIDKNRVIKDMEKFSDLIWTALLFNHVCHENSHPVMEDILAQFL